MLFKPLINLSWLQDRMLIECCPQSMKNPGGDTRYIVNACTSDSRRPRLNAKLPGWIGIRRGSVDTI